MIFQVKKLFLSLIFTVALCCGLSVSSFAWEYNLSSFAGSTQIINNDSVSFSVGQFPLVVSGHTGAYTSGWISDSFTFSIPAGTPLYFNFIFPSFTGVNDSVISIKFYKNLLSSSNCRIDLSDYSVSYSGVSSTGALSAVSHSYIYNEGQIVGVSFVGNTGNDVTKFNIYSDFYMDANSFVSQTFSSYNDFIISTEPIVTASPTLSVTATNVTSTSAQLNFIAENLDPAKQYQIRMEEIANPSNSDIIATFSGSETFSDSGVVGPLTPNFTYNSRFTLIEDGVDTSATVDLSFTTLPKVYNPQISASQFSVTSTTFTSTVTLSDLDPTHTYKPFWALYAKSDMTQVVASGYAAEIGEVTGVENYTGYSRVVNLSPSTAYQVNWTLLDVTEDRLVPSVSDVEFTTLGDGSGGGAGSSDDSPGILLMILNKVSAILDTLNGGQSEGILVSINEKLDALIDTLANPEEQELEDNFKESLTGVNDNFFGDSAKGQAVTVSDVGNLADTQSTVKNIFQSDYTVTDFFNLFSDTSLFAWFSAETALDLNPNAYGGVALADMDDPYNMQSYYDNLVKVRGKK